MINKVYYVIDTSSFIAMKSSYPMSVFKSFWKNCDELISEGRFGAPTSVFEEIRKQEDELYSWVKVRHKDLFRDDSDFVEPLAEIVTTFPKYVEPNSDREKADLYVVAMARELKTQQTFAYQDVYVVTQELNLPKPKKKLRIPEVCKEYKIHCIEAPDITVKEGWVI